VYDAAIPEHTGSPYLIYSGVIIHEKKWKQTLHILKNFRKRIAREGILKYDQELHCAELVDPKKTGAYAQISVPDRWKLIEEFCYTIGAEVESTIITVILDKRISSLAPAKYTTETVTKLFQAFNHFLKQRDEYGIFFFDRARHIPSKNMNFPRRPEKNLMQIRFLKGGF